jgi:hypothetical protein
MTTPGVEAKLTRGAAEPLEMQYARHTRNAVVFIAVLAGIAAVITLVGVIITAVQVSNLSRDFGQLSNVVNSSSSSSNCESAGGTDPTC